jgi:hypothetical protein
VNGLQLELRLTRARRAALRLVLGAAMIFTLSMAAAPLLAASPDPPGPWTVTVFGGWYSGSTPYLFRGPFTDEVELGSAPCYGLRVGHDIGSALNLELGWTQARPTQSFTTVTPSDIRTIVMNSYELDLNVYIGHGTVRGLATFGLGGANTGSSFGGANLTVTVGLGAEIFLNRHLAVRIDGRATETYGNVGHEGDPAFCDSGGCYYYRKSWYANAAVTGGVTYAF